MRVEASVDEADIGQLKDGQRVEFTVDAFPMRKFSGQVTEIRLQPVEKSNVITYTVVINAPNPEKILMPGMTANATFFVTERKDIPLVPAKALRFTPDQAELIRYYESISAANPPAPFLNVPQEQPKGAIASDETGGDEIKTVWVKNGAMIHPQKVEVGVTDEIHYEVISGLKEGDEVVLSMNTSGATLAGKAKTTEAKSPFMPQRPGSNRKTTTK